MFTLFGVYQSIIFIVIISQFNKVEMVIFDRFFFCFFMVIMQLAIVGLLRNLRQVH